MRGIAQSNYQTLCMHKWMMQTYDVQIKLLCTYIDYIKPTVDMTVPSGSFLPVLFSSMIAGCELLPKCHVKECS